jgi:hypothetical protein
VRPASRLSPRPPSGYDPDEPVAARPIEARATFLTRTYVHLLGAVLAFALLELLYFATGLALPIAQALLGTSWLVVLGGFVIVSWLATRVAHAASSPAAQYGALGTTRRTSTWAPRSSCSPRSRCCSGTCCGCCRAGRRTSPGRARVTRARGAH